MIRSSVYRQDAVERAMDDILQSADSSAVNEKDAANSRPLPPAPNDGLLQEQPNVALTLALEKVECAHESGGASLRFASRAPTQIRDARSPFFTVDACSKDLIPSFGRVL